VFFLFFYMHTTSTFQIHGLLTEVFATIRTHSCEVSPKKLTSHIPSRGAKYTIFRTAEQRISCRDGVGAACGLYIFRSVPR
jgi:hypothetical protein